MPATTERIWAMVGALGLPGVPTLGPQVISPVFLLSFLDRKLMKVWGRATRNDIQSPGDQLTCLSSKFSKPEFPR